MQSITRKPDIKALVDSMDASSGLKMADGFAEKIFTAKVRFPLLEYAADIAFLRLEQSEHKVFSDAITSTRLLGSYPVAGKLLQHRLNDDFDSSLEKAREYMIAGDEWYVCDIIGERVQGHAVLTLPEKTIPELKKQTIHSSKWIVRSVGVATHYAVKKGLDKKFIRPVFELLLSQADSREFHTKKGIGWAVKTIAKFHPDIISGYQKSIYENPEIKQWFKTKIRIGLDRSARYATGNKG